jgi:hypothetical protein
VADKEEVFRGCQPGVERLPFQQVAFCRKRIWWRLIQPRNYFVAGLPERFRRAGYARSAVKAPRAVTLVFNRVRCEISEFFINPSRRSAAVS